VRIGAASTLDELLSWHEWEYSGLKRSTWVAALALLLDSTQGGYQSQDLRTGHFHAELNTLWQSVIGAFVDEGGFRILVKQKRNTSLFCILTRLLS